MQTFEPRPAATEIERVRRLTGLSVRAAAKKASLSEGRWRQIAKGSQAVVAGHPVPVRAPDETYARMAIAVGVTAADLRNVGEPDVAATLEHLQQPMTVDEFQAQVDQTRVDQTASAGVAERLARLEADVGAMENRLRILEAREAARGNTPAVATGSASASAA